MPSINFSLTAKEFGAVAARAAIARLDSDEYAKTILLESIAPRTATTQDIARRVGVAPTTVRLVLAGRSSRVSKESARAIKAIAAEMGYRPTLKDIAAAAGMSPMAVSLALTDTGRLSLESRDRIKETAKTMGWRANLLARGLRKRRS